MFLALPYPCRSRDADLREGSLPDMVEVVRFAPRSGRGPGLVVSHQKASGALLARLRRVATETEDA